MFTTQRCASIIPTQLAQADQHNTFCKTTGFPVRQALSLPRRAAAVRGGREGVAHEAGGYVQDAELDSICEVGNYHITPQLWPDFMPQQLDSEAA